MDSIDGLHKSSFCGGVRGTDTILEWAKGSGSEGNTLFRCREEQRAARWREKLQDSFSPSGQDWIEHICVFVFGGNELAVSFKPVDTGTLQC